MKPWEPVDSSKLSTYDLEVLSRDIDRQERWKTFAMNKACEVHRGTSAHASLVINLAEEIYLAMTMDWSK